MSAFVVSKKHIDAIVTKAAAKGVRWSVPTDPGTEVEWKCAVEDPDAMGQILMDACVKSVSYRYDTPPGGELPGPNIQYWNKPYRHSLVGNLPVVQVLKLVNGYEYQSCEHPDWETSEAKRICDAVIQTLIRVLPGYDEAEWAI